MQAAACCVTLKRASLRRRAARRGLGSSDPGFGCRGKAALECKPLLRWLLQRFDRCGSRGGEGTGPAAPPQAVRGLACPSGSSAPWACSCPAPRHEGHVESRHQPSSGSVGTLQQFRGLSWAFGSSPGPAGGQHGRRQLLRACLCQRTAGSYAGTLPLAAAGPAEPLPAAGAGAEPGVCFGVQAGGQEVTRWGASARAASEG